MRFSRVEVDQLDVIGLLSVRVSGASDHCNIVALVSVNIDIVGTIEERAPLRAVSEVRPTKVAASRRLAYERASVRHVEERCQSLAVVGDQIEAEDLLRCRGHAASTKRNPSPPVVTIEQDAPERALGGEDASYVAGERAGVCATTCAPDLR